LRGIHVFLIFVLLALQLTRFDFAFTLQARSFVLIELPLPGLDSLAQIIDLLVQASSSF